MNQTDSDWLNNFFKNSPLFSGFHEEDINHLVDYMDRANFSKGETIIKEGELGEWFFIVRSGQIKVCIKKWLRGLSKVATLGPEDFFGEMALVNEEPRSATLIAEEDSTCFMLYKSKFESLIKNNSTFKKALEDVVSKRLEKS